MVRLQQSVEELQAAAGPDNEEEKVQTTAVSVYH